MTTALQNLFNAAPLTQLMTTTVHPDEVSKLKRNFGQLKRELKKLSTVIAEDLKPLTDLLGTKLDPKLGQVIAKNRNFNIDYILGCAQIDKENKIIQKPIKALQFSFNCLKLDEHNMIIGPEGVTKDFEEKLLEYRISALDATIYDIENSENTIAKQGHFSTTAIDTSKLNAVLSRLKEKLEDLEEQKNKPSKPKVEEVVLIPV